MPVFPYLAVDDARAAIAFYEAAFGGEVLHVVRDEALGKIVHARVRIGDSVIMMHEHGAGAVAGVATPAAAGATTVLIRVLLDGRDAVNAKFDAAQKLDARIDMPPREVAWGEYDGRLRDPFGHAWAFGCPIDETG